MCIQSFLKCRVSSPLLGGFLCDVIARKWTSLCGKLHTKRDVTRAIWQYRKNTFHEMGDNSAFWKDEIGALGKFYTRPYKIILLLKCYLSTHSLNVNSKVVTSNVLWVSLVSRFLQRYKNILKISLWYHSSCVIYFIKSLFIPILSIQLAVANYTYFTYIFFFLFSFFPVFILIVLQVCREFQRGTCTRQPSECRYAHPPDNVSVDSTENQVTVCMDYVKGKCTRDSCKYFHPPPHLQALIKASQQRANNTAAQALVGFLLLP